VYLRIASTIVAEHDFLKKLGRRVPDVREVNEWLNSPTVKGWGAGVSILGSGGQFTRPTSLNTSGFSETGLLTTVDRWLRHLFPNPQAGGFVCVIDNLELLETTQRARTLLEALRDPLLSRRGLRWILCGARGIVRTSAASPRLEGRLAEPMEIEPISHQYVEAAIDKRISQYSDVENAKAPVGPQSFRHLYDVLNQNLRQAFKYAEDFSFWLHQQEESAEQSSYDPLFQIWLSTRADMHNKQTDLGRRAWEVFDQLAGRGGSCSPSDFKSFGFNSPQVMRPHIKALESENLVTTSLNDENDKRRKTIFMTARGWLVRYARSGYQLPIIDLRATRAATP
jgi:DNA-binding MarR family transcriptional regulator